MHFNTDRYVYIYIVPRLCKMTDPSPGQPSGVINMINTNFYFSGTRLGIRQTPQLGIRPTQKLDGNLNFDINLYSVLTAQVTNNGSIYEIKKFNYIYDSERNILRLNITYRNDPLLATISIQGTPISYRDFIPATTFDPANLTKLLDSFVKASQTGQYSGQSSGEHLRLRI